jgi:FKBP-type peptidyl-prolyl cis-trans isomerase
LLIPACHRTQKEQKEDNQDHYKESLLEVNKNLVKTEEQKIEDFLQRYNWDMRQTGSGLRYMIYREGNGARAEKGKVAEVAFTVSLLNGEVCYSSDEEGPRAFEIGKGGVESGLEEGILLLKEGDRAKFIIPSHLAFGLLGDMERIPAKAVLVYDIELLKIK